MQVFSKGNYVVKENMRRKHEEIKQQYSEFYRLCDQENDKGSEPI